jgi:hypothetical protein
MFAHITFGGAVSSYVLQTLGELLHDSESNAMLSAHRVTIIKGNAFVNLAWLDEELVLRC